MVPVGCVPDLENLAGIMGCKTAQLPMNYLGLPLGAKFNGYGVLVMKGKPYGDCLWKNIRKNWTTFSHFLTFEIGDGATVARAILENPEDKTKVHLIYANVTYEDILLKQELDGLATNYPDCFNIYYVLNQLVIHMSDIVEFKLCHTMNL
ncbi:NADH--cytochrome b5 reductase 1-like [Fagus crenata]